MGHDWIIDVLADVRSFARQNDMPLLSAQLDDAILAASVEVVKKNGSLTHWHDPAATPTEPHPAD